MLCCKSKKQRNASIPPTPDAPIEQPIDLSINEESSINHRRTKNQSHSLAANVYTSKIIKLNENFAKHQINLPKLQSVTTSLSLHIPNQISQTAKQDKAD